MKKNSTIYTHKKLRKKISWKYPEAGSVWWKYTVLYSQYCGSGIFIPDPGSRSASKNLSIFNTKISYQALNMTWDAYPQSRIQREKAPDPDP